MPFNKRRLLEVILELCTGDKNLLVLEEPTLGLDNEQARLVYHLINRLRQ